MLAFDQKSAQPNGRLQSAHSVPLEPMWPFANGKRESCGIRFPLMLATLLPSATKVAALVGESAVGSLRHP